MSNSRLQPHTILLLSANPFETSQLRLDEEARSIRNGIERAQRRNAFRLETRLAVRQKDLRRAAIELRPLIVHFCGHARHGIVLEGDSSSPLVVEASALEGFFKILSEHVRCVVLNACHTSFQAKAIGEHIDFVVGTNSSLDDRAAFEYSEAFYDSLFADGNVSRAHEIGCNAIAWKYPNGNSSVYRLFSRDTVAPSDIFAIEQVDAQETGENTFARSNKSSEAPLGNHNISHADELIEILGRRLNLLEKQAAAQGIHTAPHVLMEIEDLRKKIHEAWQTTQ